VIDWLFSNRKTGEITIAQFPNLALWIFLIATAVRWMISATGTSATILEVLAGGALLWWGVDEIVRGVNPFRRMLGALVVTGELILLMR
jgi:hypothetical protein